jgi:hypothetical protein
MTTEAKINIQTWAEWILRLITPAAAMIAAGGFLWLRSEFLPRTEFEEYRKETSAIFAQQTQTLNEIQRTLAIMAEQSKRYEIQLEINRDFEQRLRGLERSR